MGLRSREVRQQMERFFATTLSWYLHHMAKSDNQVSLDTNKDLTVKELTNNTDAYI